MHSPDKGVKMKDKKLLLSILFRISAILAVLGIVCLLICEKGTAEFAISLTVVLLNVAMATVAVIAICKDKTE